MHESKLFDFCTTVSVTMPCLHRTRTVCGALLYCETVNAYTEYTLCTAWMYCNGPAGIVTATSHVRGVHGPVII